MSLATPPLRPLFRARNILPDAHRTQGLGIVNANWARFWASYAVSPIVEQEIQHGKT